MTMIAVIAALISPPGLVRHAQAQSSDRAVALVKNTSDLLVAIVNSADSPQEKRSRLQGVIDGSVDIEEIGPKCLGRFWNTASPDQRKQYLALFRELLVSKIAAHLGEYHGVRVTMGPAQAGADNEIVVTKVERPENPPSEVEWVVSATTGNPKILDLLSEGTSLRVTQTADFAAYLAHHKGNVEDLLDGMRQLIARNEQ
jgi:phospholipid transport system substrate-binding protein